jgi:prolipoprotein diacylglyceryl transferase
VLKVATVAVPVGIVGARVYSVVTDWGLYFGRGRDWTNMFRIWQGGLGMAGAVAAGALATWLYCRRNDINLGPLALAAAPALPVAQAIAVWGNWFSQGLYGRPSGLPWAVAIGPAHRANGYQASATFQPIFLYESVLYLLVAAAVAYAIRRYRLTGDRAFALYAGLYATARFIVEEQRVGYTPRLFGLRTNEAAMLVILIAAWAYLVAVHSRERRRPAFAMLPRRAVPVPATVPVRPLRPRSHAAAFEAAGPTGQAQAAEAGQAGQAGGSPEVPPQRPAESAALAELAESDELGAADEPGSAADPPAGPPEPAPI